MEKTYCEILEWNYRHGRKVPVKNIAKGLTNWMRKNEADYNGKWENLDLASDMNKNLYWFLDETGLTVSDIRGLVKDRLLKEQLIKELLALEVQVKERFGKLHLYDLKIHGDKILENEKSIINKFIYWIRRKGTLIVDTFQPVIKVNELGQEARFGVSKSELSELLEKHEQLIKDSGIQITSTNLPEVKIFTYSG